VKGVAAVIAAAVLAGGLVWPADAWSQEEPAGLVGHYVNDEETFGFILDRASDPLAMRFDDSSVLGPRGDTIYKLDDGTTILRETNFGSITLFDETRPEGRPVVRDGDGESLELAKRFPAQIRARAVAISNELNAILDASITFEADWDAIPDLRLGTGTLGDAVENAGIALKQVAQDELGRTVLKNRIKRVTFTAGDVVSAKIVNETLAITYVWTLGIRGRLSSDALVGFLEEAL
jgi:hypothetical protein